jgi:TPR repeat protein
MRIFNLCCVTVAALLVSPAFAGDYEKGKEAYECADYETALAEWQPLAEAGDADGQYGLGQMYGNGFGVLMDDAAAIKYYTLAAAQGHSGAQYNLAIMHQNGWGLPQSDAEATVLYEQAAEQGVTAAMLALGRFYSMDFDPRYDPVVAYKWYGLAVMMGDLDAVHKLEEIIGKMNPEQVAEAVGLVDKWTVDHTGLLADQ